jgi:hypothetical protein
VVVVFHVAMYSASIRDFGARVNPRTTSRNKSRAPMLIGYLTAHTMPSKQTPIHPRFPSSRSAPSTQTPVPDRATSQHPPNSHKTNINASSRAQQSCEISNPTNLRNRTAPPFRRSSSCAPRRPVIWEHPSRGLGQGYVGTRSPPRSGPRVR